MDILNAPAKLRPDRSSLTDLPPRVLRNPSLRLASRAWATEVRWQGSRSTLQWVAPMRTCVHTRTKTRTITSNYAQRSTRRLSAC